jgi:hypothetical protein
MYVTDGLEMVPNDLFFAFALLCIDGRTKEQTAIFFACINQTSPLTAFFAVPIFLRN